MIHTAMSTITNLSYLTFLLFAINSSGWRIETKNYSSFLLDIKKSCKASGIFFLYDHRSESKNFPNTIHSKTHI